MAVPFSKPLYPGGPPRRVGPPRRRNQHHHENQSNNGPRHNQNEQSPGHPNHQQLPEQTTVNLNQQNYQHPIERFLYGDGVIQLDRLSRVTRIAFYALFEAWRLLQDLSPNQTRSITQGHDNPQQNNIGYQITTGSTQLSGNNQAPVQSSPSHGLTVVEASNTERKMLPDVVLASTQSTPSSSDEFSNSDISFNGDLNQERSRFITQRHSTPIKKSCKNQDESFFQNETNEFDLGKVWNKSRSNNNKNHHDNSDDQNEDDDSGFIDNHCKSRNRRDSEANFRHLEQNRKFFDDHEVRLRNAENNRRSNTITRLRRSSFSTSDLPDLVPLSERDEPDYPEMNIMNCDYSGGIGMQKLDDDVDDFVHQIDFGKFSPFNGKSGNTKSPWEKQKRFHSKVWDDDDDIIDYEERYCDRDDMFSDDKKILSRIVSPNTSLDIRRENSAWSNSGLLLVELASAFEMSYGVAFSTEEERQQYEFYRRMKADLLRNQARYFYGNNDQSIFGVNVFELGKAVLSQALLTGMWFMLKRIKIV